MTTRALPLDADFNDALRPLFRGARVRLVGALVAVAAVGGLAWALSGRVRAGLAAAATAEPHYATLAGVGFVVSLVATAFAWRRAFQALGVRIDRLDACARYATGSLVNAFLPARLGDGARALLYARAVPEREDRLLRAAGAVGAIALSRALVHAVVIALGSAVGAVPRWPVFALGVLAVTAVALAAALRGPLAGTRIVRLVEATAALARQPRLGLALIGWSALAVCGRLAAAAAAVSALGVQRPLAAAIAITAALDLAAAFPLSPGALGITSGAVSLALVARGVALSPALGVGLVFHAVETLSSFCFAGASIGAAARPRLAARPSVRIAVTMAAAIPLAFLGASMAFDLT